MSHTRLSGFFPKVFGCARNPHILAGRGAPSSFSSSARAQPRVTERNRLSVGYHPHTHPKRDNRLGLFYGVGGRKESCSYLWLHWDPEIQWRRDLGPRGKGPQEHRVWPVYMWQLGPRTNGPNDNLNILSPSPSAIPGSKMWQALLLGKGWGLQGRLSPSKHLIPTFVLARKKTKACLGREGALGTEGRSEPAAGQTLWIRFQSLHPTPSPSVVICVRGSVTLQASNGPREPAEFRGTVGRGAA